MEEAMASEVTRRFAVRYNFPAERGMVVARQLGEASSRYGCMCYGETKEVLCGFVRVWVPFINHLAASARLGL